MPDIDWGQVVFLILFVVVGFIRWLGNLIQQQKEAKERPDVLTPEQRALREAAWRRQTGRDNPVDPAPAPTSTQLPPDPLSELKEFLKQLKQEVNPPPRPASRRSPVPQSPPSLPPLMAQPPQHSLPPPIPVTAQVSQEMDTNKVFPTSASVARSFTEAVAHRDRRTAGSLMRLRRDLRSPASLRRAIVIREILGPPKSLGDD
jgi:hypothetical protein